jgi:Na+:H+ antiporter, NhaA family
MKQRASHLFKSFFENEKSSGIVLILFTLISLFLANSSFSESYKHIWHTVIGGFPTEIWINDGLMTFFFLLIGLELKREFMVGELSSIKKALLPVMSALGGMVVPAAIYFYFNYGTDTISGYGIPMATDIAFALGALSLLGKRVPLSIKVFLTALAVIDDLGAIIVIAIFYTSDLQIMYLFSALAIFFLLLLIKKYKINQLWIYLTGGVIMWIFMHNSGIHATITGVLLAFTIPSDDTIKNCPSSKLQSFLHIPVPFIVLPIFAMANTAVHIGAEWDTYFGENLSKGILFGLLIGKPLGIALFTFLAVKLKISQLPGKMNWQQVIGVGFLGGIGFTMSIFVTLLAFDDIELQDKAKFVILITSVLAGFIGFIWLKLALNRTTK